MKLTNLSGNVTQSFIFCWKPVFHWSSLPSWSRSSHFYSLVLYWQKQTGKSSFFRSGMKTKQAIHTPKCDKFSNSLAIWYSTNLHALAQISPVVLFLGKLYHKILQQIYRTPLHPTRHTQSIFLLKRTHQFTYSFKVIHNCQALLAQWQYPCTLSLFTTPKSKYPYNFTNVKKNL